MKRALLGLVKGLVVGIGVGVLFSLFDRDNHLFWTKLVLGGLTGALTGFVSGPGFWKPSVRGHALFRALVGTGVGVAFLALAYWIEPTGAFVTRWTSGYVPVAALLGGGWGAFVEWDESRKS